MLTTAFIPLVGHLAENIGKDSTITYEIKSNPLTQDEVQTKRNIYYIILDAMMDVETASQVNIVSKNEVLNNLSNDGLRYIHKSISTYSVTPLTLASIMLLDYHQAPDSRRYYDISHFFPNMMIRFHTEVPLISYLKEANSTFYWSGNSWAGCNYKKYSCIESSNDISPRNSFKFYLSTPLPKIYKKVFTETLGLNSLDRFSQYIDKNGTPKTPFFAFIHHTSPHYPYLYTSECEPTNYFKQHYEGYTAAYQCALQKVKIFMEKINATDPEAIVIFQSDHGWNKLNLEMTEKEKYQFRGRIFNAIKAPEACFDKYGLPQTNVNTVRFALNCAYGFKLPYRRNSHYESYYPEDSLDEFGTVIERQIYD